VATFDKIATPYVHTSLMKEAPQKRLDRRQWHKPEEGKISLFCAEGNSVATVSPSNFSYSFTYY
jgi:hypothetical protein|tara:strand:+ start:3423 stop:3614 length:192 start_codon:yes stop_codon:yes gene_type:complete